MTGRDELLELFQAEKSTQPPAAAAERGWQRLTQDLVANVPPMSIGTGALKPGLWLVPKWILAGLVLGFAGAAVSSALTPSAVAVRAPVSVGRAANAPSNVAALPGNTQAQIEPTTTTPETNARTEAAIARAVAAPNASVSTTFDAELRLISRSKAALDAHQFAAARAALDEHAAQFPTGVFATERDALSVLVSCAQGPRSEALAKHFELQHPGSPLAERLDRACGSTPVLQARSPALGASADFSKLPNGGSAPGERMAEPSKGLER